MLGFGKNKLHTSPQMQSCNFGSAKLCIISGINEPPMAPHGLILSENEATPSTMLFILLLGLFEPTLDLFTLYAFLMQIRPQGSGPWKLANFCCFYPMGSANAAFKQASSHMHRIVIGGGMSV